MGILAIALFITIGGEIVMHLWNWLLPALFGWREITFWQALGILVLCRILFGGLGRRRPVPLQLPPQNGGSHGLHDAGGARTIPAGHSRTLRVRACCRREQIDIVGLCQTYSLRLAIAWRR